MNIKPIALSRVKNQFVFIGFFLFFGFIFYLFFGGGFGFFGCLFAFSRAAPTAYGSQARCRIRAVAAGPSGSHSDAGSKPHLQTTPQLTARLDP